MGIFDSIQNLIGGVSDSITGSVGDVVGGITDNQIVQDIQDQAGTVSDGVTEAISPVTEIGQNVLDNATQNLDNLKK